MNHSGHRRGPDPRAIAKPRVEHGVVVRKRPGKALVRMNRTTRCRGCNICLLADGGRYMVVEADDPLGVTVGERVRIDSREPSQIGGGFLLFIAPLLTFVAGYLLAETLASSAGIGLGEGAAVVGGLVGMAVPLAVITLRHRSGAAAGRAGMRVTERLPSPEGSAGGTPGGQGAR